MAKLYVSAAEYQDNVNEVIFVEDNKVKNGKELFFSIDDLWQVMNNEGNNLSLDENQDKVKLVELVLARGEKCKTKSRHIKKQ
jgi:hypothetical protein